MPILLIGAIALMIVDHQHPVQSLEGIGFDRAYAFAFAVVMLWLLGTLFRLAVIWLECRRLLIALDSIPLRRSFHWLTGFSWKPIWRVRGSFLQDSFRIIEREMDSLQNLFNVTQDKKLAPPIQERDSVDQAYRVATSAREMRHKGDMKEVFKNPKELLKELAKISREFREPKQPTPTSKLIDSFEGLQTELAAKCACALKFLSTQWAKEARPQDDSRDKRRTKPASGTECKAEKLEDRDKDDLPLETLLAEQFVCLVYVNFILSVLMRMRTLVMAAVGMFVFLLLSIGCYPFEPKQALYSLLILLFLLIVVFVAVVYAQMHRDSTLSRITDTTPGELGLDFWIRLAGFTAVPLLSLFLAQYPGVNNFLFSWLEPALQGWR
jgi:hypothetical protein